jgi:hypothetical protein
MSDWTTLLRRTNDPKLGWLERLFEKNGIPSRRNGESFHAPILEVPKEHEEAAWDLLDHDIDEMADDDPMFEEVV